MGQFYDLEQRRFYRVPVENELWFDPQRGLREIERVEGRVVRDVFSPPGLPELDRQFLGLASAYRRALRDRDASVGERSQLDGRPVYWISFRVSYRPAGGIPIYDSKHRVAVDAETFEPLAWRADGRDARILRWETLPGGQGDFDGRQARPNPGDSWFGVSRVGFRAPGEARDALGTPALWLGEAFENVPLAFIREVHFETGRLNAQPRVLALGLDLCYGTGEPCVVGVTETTKPLAMAGRGHGWDVVPPPGSAGVSDNGRYGWFVRDGLYVTIEAGDREQVIAAAEALTPIP